MTSPKPEETPSSSDSFESASTSPLTAWLGRTIAHIAGLSYRNPIFSLVLVGLITALGGVATSRLSLDPDVTQLLPPHYESVRDVDELREHFGGVGYVVLLLEGGTQQERRDLADRLGPRLEQLDTVSYVEIEPPAAYLKKKALWLFEKDDLETLQKRVQDRYHYEINRQFLDLDDEEPPVVQVDDLAKKFADKWGQGEGSSATGAEEKSAFEIASYYEDEERLAVFVRPTELASNLQFSQRVVEEVEGIIAEVQSAQPESQVQIALTGRYKKRVDLQEVLGEDLARTGILSMSLVAAYVAFHFRRFSAVLLLMLPLNAGLILSYGLAGAWFGSLNILTSFLGAILLGIGIDNGIHILGRVQEEEARGTPREEAIRIAFRDAGRVSLAAATTTACAFACLTWTDFRAFREFGWLTAVGVLLVLFCYIGALPALLRIAARFKSKPAPLPQHLPGTGWMQRYAATVFAVIGVLCLLAGTQMTRVSFNADFSKLDHADLPSFHLDHEVTKILGRSQTPLVIFTQDKDEARLTAEQVRSQMQQLGEARTIGEVSTLPEILPDDIPEKREILADIRRMLSRVADEGLDPKLKKDLPVLREMVETSPPALDELPESIRHALEPKSKDFDRSMVLLYPSVSMGDAEAVQRLSDQVRHIELPTGQQVRTAGESMVLSDILTLIANDGPRILLATLLFVLVMLRITLGSTRLALIAAVPALFTIIATLGALAVMGIELNPLNIIIMPILLGIGVDDGAHFVARLEDGTPLDRVWGHTGADVTGAILTDIFGFGVLAFAAHPGLASLGKVAIVGLSMNLILCVVVLPAVLELVPLVGPAHPRNWPERRRAYLQGFVTSLGMGTSRFSPRLLAAWVAFPVAALFAEVSTPWRVFVIVLCVALTFTALHWAAREGTALGEESSPRRVVVDKTLGMLVALLVIPWEFPWTILALLLFVVSSAGLDRVRRAQSSFSSSWALQGAFLGLLVGGLTWAVRWLSIL